MLLPPVRTRAALAALVAVALTAAACSSSGGGGGKTGSSSGAVGGGGSSVDVKNFSFTPATLDVKVGTKVTWTFDDSAKHNVTAGDKSFKSTDLSSGGTYSYTFNTAGTYDYICTIHQYMHGTVKVS